MGRTSGGSGGGGGALTLIDSVTLSASAASITFSSIPATYNHLLVKGRAQSAGISPDQLWCRLNGDSGGNYGGGGFEYTASLTSVTQASGNNTAAYVGAVVGSANFAAEFSGVLVEVPLYADTATYHTVIGWTITQGYISATTVANTWATSEWRSNSAIDTLEVFAAGGDLTTHSSLWLYGLT